MNHKELVEKAKFWLMSAKGCNPVFTEKGSSASSEMPDAIGWNANDCIVVECKTSKSDLLADRKKEFRTNGLGMGTQRYYLLPIELYETVRDDFDFMDFGVVVVFPSGKTEQVRFKHSSKFVSNERAEIYYLRNRILEIQQFGR